MTKLKWISLLAITGMSTSLLFTGCAHTGLVTGPKVTGPAVDRVAFVDGISGNIRDEFTPEHHDLSAYEEKMADTDTIQSSINDVKSEFKDANIAVKDNESGFHDNLTELDTEIETATLPELESLNTELPTFDTPLMDSIGQKRTAGEIEKTIGKGLSVALPFSEELKSYRNKNNK